MLDTPWPALLLREWEETKNTLHLEAQIAGKIRLALAPKQNHWWHVPFYVSARGFTTSPIPHAGGIFEMEFDLLDHGLAIRTGQGDSRRIPLGPRAVADFYSDLFANLEDLGIRARIRPRPFGLPVTEPFPSDRRHASYDPESVSRFRLLLQRADTLLKEFRGRFLGKCSPVHLFWHSFDLAVTRFSGRPAPPRAGADPVTREAYSHEVISSGFWAGDQNVGAPAFYVYVHPEPPGLTDEPLRPGPAIWKKGESGSLALLAVEDLRGFSDPDAAVLEFLQSVYEAGARRAGWDRQALDRPARDASPR